jgi:esterase/lipase superfamily enzyme
MVYASFPNIARSDKEEVDLMKITADSFSTQHSEHAPDHHQAQKHAARTRYILVAVLLAIVYMLSSWTPADSNLLTSHIGSGFVVFWLAGGGITLGLLALAARKHH